MQNSTIEKLVKLYQKKEFSEVLELAERIYVERLNSVIIWIIVGASHYAIEEYEKAERCFRHAVAIDKSAIKGYQNLGLALKAQGKIDDALNTYLKALTIQPDCAELHFGIGTVYHQRNELENACASYMQAINYRANYAEAYCNLGAAFHSQGEYNKALSAYRNALTIEPNYSTAYGNMANTLRDQGHLSDAMGAYEKAILLNPKNSDAINNMGIALRARGEVERAVQCYQNAININPNDAHAHNNLANILKDRGKLDEAIISYERAVLAKADFSAAEAQLIHQKQHICDFTISKDLPSVSARLAESAEAIPPFLALSWVDDPKQQLIHSKKWAAQRYTNRNTPQPEIRKSSPSRLKIGYYSADFHNHAGMYLLNGVLEAHNRDDFEIFAFSYGPEKNDEMRNRVSQSVDRFTSIENASSGEIKSLSKNIDLDIAIHENGYTENERTEIFESRLAPIQVSFLGYPGSLGTKFIDYIVADKTVIPPRQREHYSEKVIYLPHTYFPSGSLQKIKNRNTKRCDYGLPENAFVFCCFNNSYKIGKREFAIWMRLLEKVSGSVLWLLKSNKWAMENLKNEAEHYRIDPSRIIFAELTHHKDHLARHRHADLFIDTFNYNAHTTASDALKSGLPVVTKQGQQFPARVASSLLKAVSLTELITYTEDEYENLALNLALNNDKLMKIKAKLTINIQNQPLFDTKKYTRHLESGLQEAYELRSAGEDLRDIFVLP